MSQSTSLPPSGTDEKGQSQYGEAAGAKALADVSEALNGLRELAERVTPASAKTTAVMPEVPMPHEQLALELPKAEIAPAPASEEPAISIGTLVENLPTPEPVAIVIPSASAPEPESEPEPVAPPARKPRVGETLRDARESADFSIDDVAEEIKIKPIYLHAIEEGRYGDLPSRTYAVGWVRAYAQALGLNADELVARCRSEVGAQPKIAPAPLVMREPVSDRRLPGGVLMTVCVVLAVIVYAVSYSFLRPSAPSTTAAVAVPEVAAEVAPTPAPVPAPAPVVAAPVPVAVAPQPLPAAPAPVVEAKPVVVKPKPAPVVDAQHDEEAVSDAAFADQAELPPYQPAMSKKSDDAIAAQHPIVMPGAAAADVAAMPQAALQTSPDDKAVKVKPPSRIKLRAASDTQVRITDPAGHVLAERMIKKGESFYVPDAKHYTLATSNAGGLRISVDGHDMPPLGDSGEAMHNIPLDPSDLLQVLAQ